MPTFARSGRVAPQGARIGGVDERADGRRLRPVKVPASHCQRRIANAELPTRNTNVTARLAEFMNDAMRSLLSHDFAFRVG
jgi:hypothetical protein